jgi:decaprenylphospho-beta-D-erythro-pentofuranosid-2-ulose 2-reductase
VRRFLIFGATSAIARGAARVAAAHGDTLFLVGRSKQKLDDTAADLKVRGAAAVHSLVADLNDLPRHAEIIQEADRTMGGIDTVLVAHGILTDQAAAQRDFQVFAQDLQTNYTSAASLLTIIANRFEERRAGTIAVITSVAGDRGRSTNYVYGATKAALIAFTSGLRGRLSHSGVQVLDIRPGFVDTPMTAHIPKTKLFAHPDAVGRAIYRAIERGKDVIYVPWFWRLIMHGIKGIPESIFKRLKI